MGGGGGGNCATTPPPPRRNEATQCPFGKRCSINLNQCSQNGITGRGHANALIYGLQTPGTLSLILPFGAQIPWIHENCYATYARKPATCAYFHNQAALSSSENPVCSRTGE